RRSPGAPRRPTRWWKPRLRIPPLLSEGSSCLPFATALERASDILPHDERPNHRIVLSRRALGFNPSEDLDPGGTSRPFSDRPRPDPANPPTEESGLRGRSERDRGRVG